MLANEHEYKVMGLAPYHNSTKTQQVEKILEDIQYLDGLEFRSTSLFHPFVVVSEPMVPISIILTNILLG